MTPEDIAWVEDRVNGWIKDGEPVRWMVMEKPEAEKLGAMALFGEKYGDLVRVVEVENVSRELCGGTHVENTAEIGIFKIVHESSSAANVRRVEAITGPDAIDWFRNRSAELEEVGHLLGDARDPLRAARDASERLAAAGEVEKKTAREQKGQLASDLAGRTEEVGGLSVVLAEVPLGNPKEILQVAKQVQGSSGATAVLAGVDPDSGKVGMVALLTSDHATKASARELIAAAAPKIGGGGGGSDEMAQAGGKNPDGVAEALAAAREYLESR